MKQCKCEHWQQCPICMPHRFDAEGNVLPPEPTPLQAARTEIERLTAELDAEKEISAALTFDREQLRAELAESKKQIGSYKALTKALEEQVSHHRRMSERYQESIKTMQSERDANAILTDELTETRDLAEHWAILAEQRRVELAEVKAAVRKLAAIVMDEYPEGDERFEFAYVTKALMDGPVFCEKLNAAMEAKP